MSKIYPLSIARDYVSAWGLAEAVRELIQNALDSDSPFDYAFNVEGDGTYSFVLRSEFSRLEARHLLLGVTSKAENEKAIGSFGEGFKIALLVLTRLGYPVVVRNGDKLWTPFFKMSEDFGFETLCIREEPAGIDVGLEFNVRGLTGEDVGLIRRACLKMQGDIGAVTKTRKGEILHDMPGEIYVGSLFICKVEGLQCGYNLNPEDITLERDRQTVGDWDLRWLLADIWYVTGKPDVVAQMIYDGVSDVSHCRYNHDALVSKAAYNIFKEKHPGALLAESPAELRRMIEDGLTTTVFVGEGFANTVKRTDEYKADREVIAPAPPTPYEFLTSWGNANLKKDTLLLKHFTEQVLETAKQWKHKGESA